MIDIRVRRRVPPDSFQDRAIRAAGTALGNGLSAALKRMIRDPLDQALGRVVTTLLAAALLIAASVFLLVAGVEGLLAVSLPPYLAYGALGIVALTGGLVLFRKR